MTENKQKTIEEFRQELSELIKKSSNEAAKLMANMQEEIIIAFIAKYKLQPEEVILFYEGNKFWVEPKSEQLRLKLSPAYLQDSVSELKEKIKTLDLLWESHEKHVGQFEVLCEKVEKLEQFIHGEHSKSPWQTEVENKLKSLETTLNIVRSFGGRPLPSKKPHTCPVCDGTGENERFILASMPPKRPECKCCEGKGIIWG